MLTEAKTAIDCFRQLVPFNRLGRAQQEQIFAEAEVLDLNQGDVVFRQGTQDGYTFYLLEGRLDLLADSSRVKQIVHGTDAGLHPVGHLQPRRLTAVADAASRVLKIKSVAIERLLTARSTNATTGESADAEALEAVNPGWLAAALKPELFAKLPPATLPQVFASMEWVKCKSGDNIIRQGDVGDYYYIIKEGVCEVRRTTSVSAHGIKLAELKPGDAFGEDALISNMRRNATVRMITDGELIRIDKDDFVALIKKPMLRLLNFDDAAARVREGAVWLDVRFPEECRNGTLPGSMNIPLNMLRMYAGKLDPAKPYVAFCDDGSRSSVAAFILRERGFNAFCVEGGCGAQLAALYAIHGPAGLDPDLTQTVIPRGTGAASAQEDTMQLMQETVELSQDTVTVPLIHDTVPHNTPQLEMETQAFIDELDNLHMLGTGDAKPLILENAAALPTPAHQSGDTTLALQVLHGADGRVTLGEPPVSGEILAAEFQARLDDYDARLREAVQKQRTQESALHEAGAKLHQTESKLHDAEAQLLHERETAEQLKYALLEAEVRIMEQTENLEKSTEQLRQHGAALEQSAAADAEREQLEQSYKLRIDALEQQSAQQAESMQASIERLREYYESAAQQNGVVAAERERSLQQRIEELERHTAERTSELEKSAEQLRQYETSLQQGSAVSAERDQLEQSYRQRIEELERLLEVQSEAEELMSTERQKLVGEVAEHRRLLEEANRHLKEVPVQEQQLKQATHAQLSELRKILGAEFARNAALVELARQEQQSAESARQRLVEQTEMVITEYRGRNDRLRAQEEMRMHEERRLLEMEREFLRTATEAANRAREQSEAMIRKAEEQATRLRALAGTQIDAIEAEAAADMKRVRNALAWSGGEVQSETNGSGGGAGPGLQQEIEHEVDSMLAQEEPVPAPATSAKILELQRLDIERIQKRTEEVKLAQAGGMEVIIGGLADKDLSSAE